MVNKTAAEAAQLGQILGDPWRGDEGAFRPPTNDKPPTLQDPDCMADGFATDRVISGQVEFRRETFPGSELSTTDLLAMM